MATLVEGDPKAPISIATTIATPFLGLLHFILDAFLIILSVKQGGIKYHFLSLWYDDLGLNPIPPDHWRTLYSWGQWPGTIKIKESKKIEKYLDLAKELKKGMEHGDANWSLGMVLKGLEKTGRTGDQWKDWDNPDHSIVEVGFENFEES